MSLFSSSAVQLPTSHCRRCYQYSFRYLYPKRRSDESVFFYVLKTRDENLERRHRLLFDRETGVVTNPPQFRDKLSYRPANNSYLYFYPNVYVSFRLITLLITSTKQHMLIISNNNNSVNLQSYKLRLSIYMPDTLNDTDLRKKATKKLINQSEYLIHNVRTL